MEEQQKQLIQRLKESKNVLVTVSKDPTVDQLSAAIGLTIALNKMNKHATAVYSGMTPSALDFLKPDETLEKTTDSLRDFIIALDKSKADKLRYKVEDEVVRIFITPYHTAINQEDLDFSQGDFNVDMVIALGVHRQEDIDDAVQSHGRILHDAVVANLSLEGQSDIGVINVVDPSASSLSELAYRVIAATDKKVLDTQISTALLTGIVAMTDRFSNDRTTPEAMSASSALMAAGANQQLITAELEAPAAQDPEVETESEELPLDDSLEVDKPEASEEASELPEEKADPGELSIEHHYQEPDEPTAEEGAPSDQPQINVDENGKLSLVGEEAESEKDEEESPFADPSLPVPEDNLPKIQLKHEAPLGAEPTFDDPNAVGVEGGGMRSPAENLTGSASQPPILAHNERVLAPMPEGSQQPVAAPSPVPLPATPPQMEQQPMSASQPVQVVAPTEAPSMPIVPPPPPPEPPKPIVGGADVAGKTLSELEAALNSPHVQAVLSPPPVAPPMLGVNPPEPTAPPVPPPAAAGAQLPPPPVPPPMMPQQ